MNHLSGTLQWTGPTQCHKRKYSSVQHSTLPASTDTYPLTPIIPDTTMPKPQNAIRVVVVGAGLAGISTAIALKKQGRQDYKLTIIEKSDAVGGTWKASVYPGCGCDIAAHWYSLSTELNPDWSSHYVGQPELLAYWESLWRKYGLEKHAIFNTFVTSAEWDESAQLYHITTKNQYNGRIDRVDAEIVIFANGAFKRPLYPKDIRNLTDFQGDMFHSARWRDDISLQGKRVAVIGNGCTAAQLVPAIAKDRSTSVVNFARSAQWYIGQNNFNYHPIVKWIFSHVPGVLRAYRNIIMAGSDLLYLLHGDNPIMRRIARKIFVDYTKSVAPKEHWERLIPKHAVGCTRSIVDPGYLRCLSQENVDLRWDEIDRLVRTGIKTKSGQVIPFDVIIFATGYDVNIFESDVRGRNGRDLQEYFKEQGGLTAYLGMAMPDFPNLFTLLGPNVATSHASVVFSEETQINLVIELIKPILQHKATSFAIKEEVVDEYNTWLQKRLSGSVWADCSSYYHADRKKGKIIATFPGPVTLFWLLARTPKWHQWVGTNAEKWAEELVYETRKRYILTVIIVALSVVVWYFSL